MNKENLIVSTKVYIVSETWTMDDRSTISPLDKLATITVVVDNPDLTIYETGVIKGIKLLHHQSGKTSSIKLYPSGIDRLEQFFILAEAVEKAVDLPPKKTKSRLELID